MHSCLPSLEELTYCGKRCVSELQEVAETRQRRPRKTSKDWRDLHNNNNNNNNQILLRPKRMYYRVAYLINKVLKVPFEMPILWCIFCYRVYIFLSVSSLIFKLFSTYKTSFICSTCYLTFLSLYVSVNSNWVHPPGNP